MSPEFIAKWEHILEDVEKQKIPIQFIKKITVKLNGKRQQTINIERFIKQGLLPEQVEAAVTRKLQELDDELVSIEFALNVSAIAEAVQPETDKLLNKL
jgi:hypothetical protein